MKDLSHRERVRKAIAREKVDRLPIDFGGMFVSSIIVEGYDRLKQHLGIDSGTVIQNKRSRLPLMEEEIVQRFDVDTRSVYHGAPKKSSAIDYPDGSFRDEWGVLRKKAKGGHYINIDGPFQKISEPTRQNIAAFAWPSPDDPGWVGGLRERAEALHKNTDFAVILSLPVGMVHTAQFMRGYDLWLMDLVIRPQFAHALMDTIVDIQCGIITNLLRETGNFVDCILYGDDIAVKSGSLISVPMYKEFIQPRHKRIFQLIKRLSPAKIIYHSCGSVYPLMEYIIESGVDAINPVQVNADNMDTATLKKKFGDRIAFWGGIDTSHVLPFGSQEDVRKEVKRRAAELNGHGGFIVAAVHNIQPEVPPENICAMFDEARAIHS